MVCISLYGDRRAKHNEVPFERFHGKAYVSRHRKLSSQRHRLRRCLALCKSKSSELPNLFRVTQDISCYLLRRK